MHNNLILSTLLLKEPNMSLQPKPSHNSTNPNHNNTIKPNIKQTINIIDKEYHDYNGSDGT